MRDTRIEIENKLASSTLCINPRNPEGERVRTATKIASTPPKRITPF
jgi:hypothetical protein